MSDTPRTNAAKHNMGSVAEPHYVVDIEVARDLERELVAARAKLAEVKEQRDLFVEALKIIGQQFMKVKFNTSAAITASMIKKVLEACGE